jgi:predicted MPP superfamily phosphohydrolase
MLSHDRLKRLLAVVAGVGAATLLYARLVEPQRVGLDRYVVPVDWPGLPPNGVAILHLSDLHWRAGGAVQAAKLARLQRLLAGATYDIVVLTGDLIHDDAGLPAALAFIATLRPRLAAFSCPGNRDYWQSSFRALLAPPEDAGTSLKVRLPRVAARLIDFARKARANERWSLHVRPNNTEALHAGLIALGVQPLVNTSAHVTGNGIDLWIAGVDDLTQGQPDLTAALAGVPAGAPVILLAHNPDAWLDPTIARADLVLAGHTHGGQFRVPWIGALHTQGTYLSRQRPAGWFERGRSRMFVSRGLGESFPFRFGAPPQAVLIRMAPRE